MNEQQKSSAIKSEAEKMIQRGLLTHRQAALYCACSESKIRLLLHRRLIGESAPGRIAKAELDRYFLACAEDNRKGLAI